MKTFRELSQNFGRDLRKTNKEFIGLGEIS